MEPGVLMEPWKAARTDRTMSDDPGRWRRRFSELLGRVDRHWFGEGSFRDLAIARIVIVGGNLLFFYPRLERHLTYAHAHPDTFMALPALKVLLLPLGEWGIRPDPTLIHAVWIVGIVAGLSGLVGKYTRLSLTVHAASATILWAHHYSYGTVHHTSSLLVIALWALAVGPTGRTWSLDDLQRRVGDAMARGRFVAQDPSHAVGALARWPLLLIQWILALSYFSAGMSKLVYGGVEWFHSSTLTHYLVQDAIRQGAPYGLFLTGFPTLLSVIAVGTVLFELAFPLAVIIPRTAWVFLGMGLGMHVGIELTMGAPFLTWSLLYVAFLPSLRGSVRSAGLATKLDRFVRPQRKPRRWTVVYDGYCSLCIRSMTVLDYLDTHARIEPMDLERDWNLVRERAPSLTRAEARHAMHVLTPDGRQVKGFHAARELTRALPALWPLAPITHLPGSGTVGPWIYRSVAGRRSRNAPCGTDGCAVASRGSALP